MNDFFNNRDKLIQLLIKQRCRYATKLSTKAQLEQYVSRDLNPREKTDEQKILEAEEELIRSLFPPRSQWVKLGKKLDRSKMDGESRNRLRLWKTYLLRKDKVSEEWVQRLNAFVYQLQQYIYYPNREELIISVHPEYKKVSRNDSGKSTIECRPLCSFRLLDRLALSYLNYYLTLLFDENFKDNSFAFRVPKDDKEKYPHVLAILKLQEFRQKHSGKILYVAECDMKKFYDTIEHLVIQERFFKLLALHPEVGEDVKQCILIWLDKYLCSYNFYDNVYLPSQTYPQNDSYWGNVRKKARQYGAKGKCQIGWLSELTECDNQEKRGIPQGGALSTLIANVVLNEVDEKVCQSMEGQDMEYLRFCDDMILVGTDEKSIRKTFDVYTDAIRNSQLFPHQSENIQLPPYRNFWNGKTRAPYAWGPPGSGAYVNPWVTFVGFDCNWEGQLRIRKSTLRKEIQKQYNTAFEIINSPHSTLRCTYDSTMGYIRNKLVAMSVGRVNLNNFSKCSHVHSWLKAFEVLDENRWSRWQFRQLDKGRNRTIHKVKKIIKTKQEGNKTASDQNIKVKTHYFGKMFSYYGQGFAYRKPQI